VEGRLPPILPIVIYNGKSRWNYPTQISTLIKGISPEFSLFVPRLDFLLMDEGSYSDEHLASPEMKKAHNFVAGLFRLEKCTSKSAILKVVADLT
jgi:hypothetical protein